MDTKFTIDMKIIGHTGSVGSIGITGPIGTPGFRGISRSDRRMKILMKIFKRVLSETI